MSEFPHGWSTRVIEEICDIHDYRRIPLSSEQRRERKGPYPYYGANNIQDRIDDFIFDFDAVLLAEDGGYYDEHEYRDIAQYATGKYWVNNHAHILTGKPGLDTRFLYYALVRKNICPWINTGTRSKLNQSDLKQIELLVPPLPEQKKIAEILSGIDNYIRRLRQQGRKLDVAKAALSKELISGSSEPTKESLYGQIPEHWKESSLGEAVGIENLQTGPFGSQLHAHEYTSEGIPGVMPQHMRDCRVVTNKIARITTDRAQSLEKHRVLTGDILFSRRGDIGRHAVIAENESGWICGTGCLRARTHGAINPVFLSELLRHKFALEWLNANAVGQTMLNLNTGILSGLPLVIPPKEEQDKIANSLSSINERSKKIGDQISLAQNLKAAISSDLLSGRKRISV